MDYVAHLSPVGQQVHALVIRKVRILEDSPICKKHDFFGYFDASRREMSICTSRIKTFSHWDRKGLINETLMHESVHVAQACNSRAGYLKALGVRRSSMPLNATDKADLQQVLAYDSRLGQIDHEAIFMQSRPSLVLYVVKKYCF